MADLDEGSLARLLEQILVTRTCMSDGRFPSSTGLVPMSRYMWITFSGALSSDLLACQQAYGLINFYYGGRAQTLPRPGLFRVCQLV
jgi:hypothetical protein